MKPIYIKKEVALKKVSVKYNPIVKDVKSELLKFSDKIHSIYLYGSVATGKAKSPTSDLDIVVVLKAKPSTKLKAQLKDLETVQFIWDENWARSEKQKRRYKEYKGEEMHFFSGKIKEFTKNEEQHEDYWEGEKLMPISKAIKIIEKEKPFPENMKVYREAQLKFLNQINNT